MRKRYETARKENFTMKKLLKSKRFLFSALIAACVGILAVCFLVSREQKNDFQPEEASISASPQTSPVPSPAAAKTEDKTSAHTPVPSAAAEPMEEYPKVVDESEDQVVIDFTPEGEELQPESPEPPVADGDPSDPSAPPSYTPKGTEPEQAAPPVQDTRPSPGTVREDGAIYDPVFGWVVPGQVEQSPADSNGDPNKMVGDM